MVLITGGAFQGKTHYAKESFGFSDTAILHGGSCDAESVFTAKCVKQYHLLIGRLLADGTDPIAFTERLCEENGDAVIIMDEIGCGIIPLEKSERLWREAVGRSGCILAEASAMVVRISCGIPVMLKGAQT